MERPSPILVIALISAIGGLVFLAPTLSGNNWLMNSISTPTDSPGLLPIANAIGKDLMLDVSPQLHPSVVAGEGADGIKFEHWVDPEVHCEDCLRLEIPNNGRRAGAAFSNEAGYNFEEAKKLRFYTMGEEEGAKVNFKAVGKDKAQNPNNPPGNNNGNADLFTNQEFALTSQNVTLNNTWNYHEINLEGVQDQLGNVKYPFAFEVEQGKGRATIFYLKGIVYSSEPVQEQYLLESSSSDNMTGSTMAMTTATNVTALNVTLSDNSTSTAPVNAPAMVEFNATVAGGEEPYSFDWDFGDGARDTEDTDGNIIHTFDTPGSYNVTVDVADSLNSTGSANTVVDVAEEIVNDEEPSVITTTPSEGNLTQDSQPADSLNTTNTTAGTAATGDDDGNLTEEEAEGEEAEGEEADDSGNNTGSSTVAPDGETSDLTGDNSGNNNTSPSINGQSTSAVTTSNSPPVANAGNDLTGRPNEGIILDASNSSDPDAGDSIVSYQWEQESGPAAEMNDQNSPTPIVTLPDVDEDSTIVFSLTVNDGSVDSEEEDTVSIFVDYVDQLTNSVQQRDSGDNENDENGENGINGAQDTDQEEPAIETDSTNGNGADASDNEGEGNSEQEE